MDSIEKYKDWLEGRAKEIRDKFRFIQSIAVYDSYARLWGLIEKYNIRKQFFQYKYKNIESFVKNELYNASDDLTNSTLSIDWESLKDELKKIQECDNEDLNDYKYIVPKYLEEKTYIFFRDIIYFSFSGSKGMNLATEYFSLNIDVNSIPIDYDKRNLKDFNRVIDLMARFQWLILIFRIAKNKLYDTEIKKPKPTPKFEDLFRDKDNARKVKEIFEIRGYTINGIWQGLTNDKSELLCAYHILDPLLKSGLKVTPTARIFYSEFGLSKGYITDRMLRKIPKNIEILKEFESIFSPLLNPVKRNI